ncbi:MAG: hypothetical protein HQK96_15345, partial [Nitrospirae bacterium]|nr:hypothetical protein [Nitrospirota bacterium]
NEKVFYFFQYHRHYGVDVYLITQDVFSMPKQITTLSEYYLKAVQRSLKFNRGFIYKKMIDEEVLTNSVLPVDIKVFRMYSSYKVEETEKPKSAYTKFIVICVILLLFTIVMFKYVFLHLFVHDKKKSVNVADKSHKVGVVTKDIIVPKYKVFEYNNLVKNVDMKDNKIVVKAVSTDTNTDNKMILNSEEKRSSVSVINELYIIIKRGNSVVKMNLDYDNYKSALVGCKLNNSGEVEGFARQIYECNNGSKKIVYDDKKYENSNEVFELEHTGKVEKNKNQFDVLTTTNGKPFMEAPVVKSNDNNKEVNSLQTKR